jgi:hypothetical protein
MWQFAAFVKFALFVFATFVCLQALLDLHIVRSPKTGVANLCLVQKVSNILFFSSFFLLQLVQ